MSVLEEFKANIEPFKRKSIFEDYLDEIKELLNDGYSIKQIYIYLKDYRGLEIAQSSLYKFIRSRNLKQNELPKRKLSKNSSNHKNIKSKKQLANSKKDFIEQVIENFKNCANELGKEFISDHIENIPNHIEFSVNGIEIDIKDMRLSSVHKKYLAIKHFNNHLIKECVRLKSLVKTWDMTLFPTKFDGKKMVLDFEKMPFKD